MARLCVRFCLLGTPQNRRLRTSTVGHVATCILADSTRILALARAHPCVRLQQAFESLLQSKTASRVERRGPLSNPRRRDVKPIARARAERQARLSLKAPFRPRNGAHVRNIAIVSYMARVLLLNYWQGVHVTERRQRYLSRY